VSTTQEPNVTCIIVNWNGWRDTIECLESVLRLDYPRLTIIVCDNASSDGSIAMIEDWAKGNVLALCDVTDLAHLVSPPVAKPIPFISLLGSTETFASSRENLILIQTGTNLGFAGGNNVGIRYALANKNCDYVWLLNNDTVVERNSLSEMVRFSQANPTLGICGSQILKYTDPHEILTMGGRKYTRWSGRTSPLRDPETPNLSTLLGAPDYIEGASMLISRKCLETVGLLEESYFLYYEELDLTERARQKFDFGYSRASVVYHKEGSSIGSASARIDRSSISEFYQARNRLIFTRRYYSWLLPLQFAVVLASVFSRVLIGKWRNAGAIVRGAFTSLNYMKS
jgi:GT2 family glycosyltransferase